MAAVAGGNGVRWRRIFLLFRANGEDELSVAAASYGARFVALHLMPDSDSTRSPFDLKQLAGSLGRSSCFLELRGSKHPVSDCSSWCRSDDWDVVWCLAVATGLGHCLAGEHWRHLQRKAVQGQERVCPAQ